ncbi:unnamed protein product [Aphis gossypii]|uniref:Uncharacterized protein n=1 Tax=Aphis gossypii TaxID=80765 RepID=A0A9P0IPY3_APHGO|nr:unnamed protein product [Aphis gossypii]
MPKTSFTFGNFHFTLFIARRACVYYYYFTRTIMPMTVHVPTYAVCMYLAPESKCVAFRRTRPRRNHHHRRSTPPPSPVSAKCYILLFRKPFATYTFIAISIKYYITRVRYSVSLKKNKKLSPPRICCSRYYHYYCLINGKQTRRAV